MSENRYDLEGLKLLTAEYLDRPRPDEEELGAFLEKIKFVDLKARSSDGYVQKAIPIHLHLNDSTSANAGRTLSDLDREVRRTAAYLLGGRLRPTRDVGSLELLSAEQSKSVDIVVAATKSMYVLLTTRSLAFLMTLSWFWDHRINRTRVSRSNQDPEIRRNWDALIASGSRVVASRVTVSILIAIDIDGATRFSFFSSVTQPTECRSHRFHEGERD